MNKTVRAFSGLVVIIFFSISASAQNTSYAQFWNELAFTRPIKGKWTGEMNLGQTTSSATNESNPFSEYTQLALRVLGHYYASSRWKASASFAYFHNPEVPEISQQKYPELRLAPQAIYFIKKTRFTLTTRMMVELRLLKKPGKNYDDAYRYRQQLKIVYPFNSKLIRQGVVYGIGLEELFVKIPGDVTGDQFFDRISTTLGAGYAITDDIQVELTYVNEFLPRPSGNELYNVIQLNFSFNNLFSNLRERVAGLFAKPEPDE